MPVGIIASDVAGLSGRKEKNLGDRIYGLMEEVDVDSVDEVRKLRERDG